MGNSTQKTFNVAPTTPQPNAQPAPVVTTTMAEPQSTSTFPIWLVLIMGLILIATIYTVFHFKKLKSHENDFHDYTKNVSEIVN